jgi:hypothetical protein
VSSVAVCGRQTQGLRKATLRCHPREDNLRQAREEEPPVSALSPYRQLCPPSGPADGVFRAEDVPRNKASVRSTLAARVDRTRACVHDVLWGSPPAAPTCGRLICGCEGGATAARC